MSQPLLELRGLVKRFGSLSAVDGVDLSVLEGEHHSIIGPNGAGKTTLFDLVTGALRPSAGRVRFQGEDVTNRSEDARARRGIVRSFQLTQLFPDLSARENLRIAVQSRNQGFNPFESPDPDLEERADRWFEALSIGVDPGAKARALPHGDKKRLEIGTALATEPALLLLDEPTSGVAEEESGELMDLVAEATEDTTVLLIEHDMDVAFGFADRVTVMDRSAVVARGPPGEIAADERVTKAYMGGYGGAALDR